MKSFQLLLVAICCPIALFSQDITGLWTGQIYNDSTQQSFDYEIAISEENGKFIGFSHTWFLIDNKKYFGVKKLKIRIAKDGKVIIEDVELLSDNYPLKPNKAVKQLSVLNFQSFGENDELNGFFETNKTKEFCPLTGIVRLKKQSNFSSSALIPHLQKMDKASDITMSASAVSLEPLVKNDEK